MVRFRATPGQLAPNSGSKSTRARPPPLLDGSRFVEYVALCRSSHINTDVSTSEGTLKSAPPHTDTNWGLPNGGVSQPENESQVSQAKVKHFLFLNLHSSKCFY